MRGLIYSDQRCLICGGAFQYEERRRGLFRPEQPNQLFDQDTSYKTPSLLKKLGWRQTISKETQQALIDEVWRISQECNHAHLFNYNWDITY